MRKFVLFALLAFIPAARLAADKIEIAGHEVVSSGESGATAEPAPYVIRVSIKYTLTSKQRAVIKFAIDRHSEMTFETVDEKEVPFARKWNEVELTATVPNLAGDQLHGVIMLVDPNASPERPPVTMTGVTLDLGREKQG